MPKITDFPDLPYNWASGNISNLHLVGDHRPPDSSSNNTYQIDPQVFLEGYIQKINEGLPYSYESEYVSNSYLTSVFNYNSSLELTDSLKSFMGSYIENDPQDYLGGYLSNYFSYPNSSIDDYLSSYFGSYPQFPLDDYLAQYLDEHGGGGGGDYDTQQLIEDLTGNSSVQDSVIYAVDESSFKFFDSDYNYYHLEENLTSWFCAKLEDEGFASTIADAIKPFINK